jgi:putative ABC transport system permease protein
VTWRDTLRTAGEAVRSHRLRSALTVLGILIGITAVILSVGIGSGASAEVREQINELGTNVLVVSPGSSTNSSGIRGGFGSSSTLTMHDADALANKTVAPDIESVAAVATTNASLTVGQTNWTTSLTGTTPSWQQVRSRDVTSGRFITDDDLDNRAAVVVLGSDTAEQLFTGRNPVGQTVTYNGSTLEVVGVLATLSSSDNVSSNDIAIVPFTTYSERLVGGTNRDSVSSIYVKAPSRRTLGAAYQEAQTLLVNLHKSSSSTNADFSIATQESILSAATTVDRTMSVMLAGIAIISLLVGGIGVMNIMLVSVTERIPEIGLRKAVGARPHLIRRQFLVEASALGLAGGTLGVAIGVVTAAVVPKFTDTKFILSINASVLAIVIAVGIGIAFGVYPATRAARLAPIDALRSE